jgi:hypothetical protein
LLVISHRGRKRKGNSSHDSLILKIKDY